MSEHLTLQQAVEKAEKQFIGAISRHRLQTTWEVMDLCERPDWPSRYVYKTADAAAMGRLELTARRALVFLGWRDAEAAYWIDRADMDNEDAPLPSTPYAAAEAAFLARNRSDMARLPSSRLLG